MLNVLATRPSLWGYTVGEERFGRDAAIDLQQIAIAQCLEWIEQGYMRGHYRRSTAQRLFEKAVARMSADGEYADADNGENGSNNSAARGQAYCENRYRLDQFMSIDNSSGNLDARDARSNYRDSAKRLGDDIDIHCQLVTTPGGTHVTYRES